MVVSFYINKSTFAMLNVRLSADATARKRLQTTTVKQRMLTIYSQAVSFLPETYAADVTFAEIKSAISKCGNSVKMNLSQ